MLLASLGRLAGVRAARRLLALACAAALALAPHHARAQQQVVVFAAASLKNALDDITAQWRRDTGQTAVVSYAGSSALARQIQQGAPADVFVSANVAWMDALAADGLIRPQTRRDLLRNRLVLVAHGRNAAPVALTPGFDLPGLLGEGRLAMALVASVPAGVYGKAALTALGVWDAVAPQVAQADNVRAALALVARGEAPYGVVYATDAVAENSAAESGATESGVTVVATFPEDTHPPIVYPAALTAESTNPRAQAFLDYLSSDAARALFQRQGFSVME